MKLSLVTVAIILSVIAVVVSLSQPTYNFLVTMKKGISGKPSFNIYFFLVSQYDAEIMLLNNGTAIAHDVNLLLSFNNPYIEYGLSASEFISEIYAGITGMVTITIPIGHYQLNSAIPTGSPVNASSYEAVIDITCEDLINTNNYHTYFHFQHF